jgi:hypothetical protein
MPGSGTGVPELEELDVVPELPELVPVEVVVVVPREVLLVVLDVDVVLDVVDPLVVVVLVLDPREVELVVEEVVDVVVKQLGLVQVMWPHLQKCLWGGGGGGGGRNGPKVAAAGAAMTRAELAAAMLSRIFFKFIFAYPFLASEWSTLASQQPCQTGKSGGYSG